MENKETKLVLTPSALLTFLSQIEEIDADIEIGVEEEENKLVVYIGDSVYILESPEESELVVDQDTVDDIDGIDQEGFDTLSEEVDMEEEEAVEGGIIKELAKTLLVGGLVRLTKGAIQNL